MLVLTRGVGDEISIGDDIKVMVLRYKDGQVRLGITAPKDMKILRTELKDEQGHGSPRTEAKS